LALREQMLAATQKQVDDKIVELKEIQSKLDTMLAQRDDAQKAQLNALVKMYETMKPSEAAKIFQQLDPRILADVAGGMKPAKVGPVLAAMETAKAQELTALLANRLVLPVPQAPVVQPQHAADASVMPTLPGGTPIVGDAATASTAPPAQPGG
jgi:flagellar motility protein MotE (MotC chaperone)